MKTSKKLLAAAVTASTIAASAVAPLAMAEVGASVGIASSYLWRGMDLGSGVPAVSGDLNYSVSGFYTGVWMSSGDALAGTEYDLYLGYGTEFGGLSVDLSVWNYIYPTDGVIQNTFGTFSTEDGYGDLSEAVLSLGYGAVSLTYYDNIAGGSGYTYTTLGADFGQFSALVGVHDDTVDQIIHADLTYSYNDNLAFTFSQVMDDADNSVDDDLKVVVSYSIPIE